MMEFDDGVIFVNIGDSYHFKGMGRWFPRMEENALILDNGDKLYYMRCCASWGLDLTIFHKGKKFGQVKKLHYSLSFDSNYEINKYSWKKVPKERRPHVEKLIEKAKEILVPMELMQN